MAESLKKYCKHCGAPIVYLITKNKKFLPIEWNSLEDDEKQSLLIGIYIPLRKGIKENGLSPLHIPHFHEQKRKWNF